MDPGFALGLLGFYGLQLIGVQAILVGGVFYCFRITKSFELDSFDPCLLRKVCRGFQTVETHYE